MEFEFSIESGKLKNILFEILKQIGIEPALIEDQVSKVMASKIKYIPIRHHSPGSSILVKKSIEKYKPKLVLIEGPFLTDNLIKYIIDKDTKPPLAILSIYSDNTNHFKLNGVISPDISIPAKFQVHYPFVSYSPEYVALKECNDKKIPVHFIDLSLTGIIPSLIREEEKFLHHLKHEEKQFTSSDFYQRLSQIFQFDNFNETWDTLFEIGTNRFDIEELRESLLLFCACIRQTIPNEESELDGSLKRERFMRHNIDTYKKKYNVDDSEILVITGGLHSVVLHDTTPEKINAPTKDLFNSLVPFSYYRISEGSGYGSGNQGPNYYNLVWRKLQENEEKSFEMAALELIAEINSDIRALGHLNSISDSINSFQGAKMLAMMRRRMEPSIKDIIDSIYMTTIKGNPEIEGAYLKELINKRVIGVRIGKITKKLGKLPLQIDFYLRIESFGIELKETIQVFSINLREEKDQEISNLFWRVYYLNLEILNRTRGPDLLSGVSGLFTEVWNLKWNPRLDIKLIELNIYGSTVEEASKNKLIEELQKNIKNFEKVSYTLYQTLVMGLPMLFSHVIDVCMDSLDKDDQFLTLSFGFNNLVLIFRYLSMMENQERNIQLILKLISRSYYSSCFSLPKMSNPPQDLEERFIIAIKEMATTLIGLSVIKIDHSIFIESLNTCIDYTTNDFIKGCSVGILFLMDVIDIDELKSLIWEYIKSEDSIKIRVGEFIRGIIFECQTRILFNSDIIELFTEIIENLDWTIFSNIIPSLRKTFADLNPREYDVFVDKIAEFYGLKSSKIKELKVDIDTKYLLFFSEIDKKVRKIFEKWFGEV